MGAVRPLWTHGVTCRTGRARHRGSVDLLGRPLKQARENGQSRAKINDDATSRQALWLDQRIADLRGRTEAAENQVQTFKVEQALVVTGGELPSEQQLKDADAA